MFLLKHLFYLIVLHFILATSQLNLYYTDWVSDNEQQHDCLRVVAYLNEYENVREIISYCLSVSSSEFNVENNDLFSKFTFLDLAKQNITSQQLYNWSAPIDLIERYQFSRLNNSIFEKEDIFYNCTMPRFGPKCQYEFYDYHLSLSEMIDNFYLTHEYNPTNLTCYTNIKCNRGPPPACLDWSEICDGKIDCLDGGFDEEYCWQLEINECKDNEYRCINGQCIPKLFYRDHSDIPDCMDGSDEIIVDYHIPNKCRRAKSSFQCQDMICKETPLTGSCTIERQNLLVDILYSIKDNSTSEECWLASKCSLHFIDTETPFCEIFCQHNSCIDTILSTCEDFLYIPNIPILFGHVSFVYKKDALRYLTTERIWVVYVCYNHSHYDAFFDMISNVSLNNKKCFVHETMPYISMDLELLWNVYQTPFNQLYAELKRYHLIYNYTSTICNRSNMYQCIHSSKCISIYRLFDTIYDCPYMDDENITIINNTNLMEKIKRTHFKCQSTNKYIPQYLVENVRCDCGIIEFSRCDDEEIDLMNPKMNISFQTICDGFVELLPININGQYLTDETECEQWQCNNIYTHCNDLWNCLNGIDELNCNLSPLLNCPSDHHICVSPETNQLMCIPFTKANDGKIDCIGATDEPRLCRKDYLVIQSANFYCMNQTSSFEPCIVHSNMCNNMSTCIHGDDEQFCEKNRTLFMEFYICSPNHLSFHSNAEIFLCNHMEFRVKEPVVYFKLDRMNHTIESKSILSSSSLIQISHQSRCHRGLDIGVWLNNNLTNACLCPPSFYGNQCQYENDRISLTIKFRTFSDSWQTLFVIIISLIDDSKERIVHSYEQINYLSSRDCQAKYNIYLLYSTRTKNQTKFYSIHIDIYKKLLLTYRGSVLLPVHFPFLPVQRLAYLVDIPLSEFDDQICSNNLCHHGRCIRYSNNPENLTFCQCNHGWSGKYCSIQYTSMCASDSLSIGIYAHNRSICVCPMNKFGSRCLLSDIICQLNDNSTCLNGGQCIVNDDYLKSKQQFVCICPKGFNGDRCQFTVKQLNLSFDVNIVLSQSIFIHFIEIIKDNIPVRLTDFRTIPVRQDSITIYWSRPFHLVFIELTNRNYYLTVNQPIYNQSTTITQMIKPSDRCPNISELFDKTFLQWHLIRRIKYYHLPCQNQSLHLSCFHDDVHLCLCYNFGQKRLANCFNFDHEMKFDCLGQSVCENNAQCLQDNSQCPTRSMCICPLCFYGIKCQFSTSGFGLSLDMILGYHILPNIRLIHQPLIIKISLTLTIIFMVAGLINGVLSMMTFNNKIVCEVGCGLYLLGSSITTLLLMIMFGLKFLILLLAQMTIISNRSFLSIQCHSMDFILRVCLCMDQWLNACVAFERAMAVIKGAYFIKKKSKQTAKFVIIILLIVIISSYIHDPVYRRLDEEESNDDSNTKRLWCIVHYQSTLQIYDYIINTIHFFGPFIINLVSVILLITRKSRQQSNLQVHRVYKEILREQYRRHRHLLTAPIVLVILALPRLIITFISKCMKSTSDSWLFLLGYFISFIPPMLTFVVFVLPSEFYRKEFRKSIQRFRTMVRRRLHSI